jgi:hypothetical protein
MLSGVTGSTLPVAANATGQVTPPAVPARVGVRALGHIELIPQAPVPSGAQVVGRVAETFDLLEGTRIVPQPFAQDILLFAYPRGSAPLALSTDFQISPSRDYGIRELALGRVLIDITAASAETGGVAIGTAGGSLVGPQGAILEIPDGALPIDRAVILLSADMDALNVSLPPGIDLLQGLRLDLGGALLGESARLSIIRPSGIVPTDSLVIAEVFRDDAGVARLQIVALGTIDGTRIRTLTQVGGFELPGIARGGDYLVLHSADPLGLVAGTVLAPSGTTPRENVLVSMDNAPFADLTGADGGYLVAGVAASDASLRARDILGGDAIDAQVPVGAAGSLTPFDLVLQLVAPRVVRTDPADGESDVLPDKPITVELSEPIDAATLSASSVRLTLDSGTPIDTDQALTADGRILRILPHQGLASASSYVLTLTGEIVDLSGNPLVDAGEVRFTTANVSKAPKPEAGQIRATFPDEEGLVQVVATQGTARAGSGVTITNLATQETASVLAQGDGSFRLRLPAAIGDELALTLRNTDGQDVAVVVTVLEGDDGSVGIGDAGGSATDEEGRIASITAGALAEPIRLGLASAASSLTLPELPDGFHYLDQFRLILDGGRFKRLSSLLLQEAQGRFSPVTIAAAPFAATCSLIVPQDFLVNGRLRFSARADDDGSAIHRVEAQTLIVAGGPDPTPVEWAFDSRFPQIYLEAPAEALVNQQIRVDAVAPAARVDFDLPAPDAAMDAPDMLLVRLTKLGGQPRLAIVDTLAVVDLEGAPVMRTSGRRMPGATGAGAYAVVASDQVLAMAVGRSSGSAQTVVLDGTPFVFEGEGPNAGFVVPVPAGESFTLSFVDPLTGAVAGTLTEEAPGSGDIDLGEPLGTGAGTLLVTANPLPGAVVDIDSVIELDFSEPIDASTLANHLVVTDDAGIRVFGRIRVSDDATRVTFTPMRRLGLARGYRFGVSTRLSALSGAHLARPYEARFSTFEPRILAAIGPGGATSIAALGEVGLLGSENGLTIIDLTVGNAPLVMQELPMAGGVTDIALLAGAAFEDREGNPISGTLGFATGSDAVGTGQLHVYDMSWVDDPVLLGRVQLSTPVGQTAPPGVPALPGTPRALAVGADLHAVVAVGGIGLEGVDTAAAIPDDPANPGAALGPTLIDEALRVPSTSRRCETGCCLLEKTVWWSLI